MAEAPSLPKRILVGISCDTDADDGRVRIARADMHTVGQAIWLAARTGAQVRLLHVTDFLDARIVHQQDVAAAVRGALGPHLDQLVAHAKEQGVSMQADFASGKPWYELCRYAHQQGIDLLMVSPRREELGVAARLFHGSTARRLIESAPVPVWVVESGDPIGVRKVLALADHSQGDELIVRQAEALCQAVGAARVVVHCLDNPEDNVLKRLPYARRAIDAHHEESRSKVRQHLEQLTGGEASGWEIVVADEWFGRAVPTIVNDQDVDLIVLASTSGPSLTASLLGTTAERILSRCYVSAWVLRPAGWKSPVAF